MRLKCTYQPAPNPPARLPPPRLTEGPAVRPPWLGPAFARTLDNTHLATPTRTPVSVRKVLVVMIVPRSRDDRLDLRYCCWTDPAGSGTAGRYARWTPPADALGTSRLVPESRAFPDSDDLLGEALLALARSAAPAARAVLVGLAVPATS